MRTIKFLLQKEFIQIFRNRTMLPMIFVLPILQLLILVFAATLDIKNIDVYVVDKDLSTTSRQLISKFEASPFFNIAGYSFSVAEAKEALVTDDADLIIHIDAGFERELIREQKAEVQILANAINGVVAGIANAYAQSIIMQYNKNLLAKWMKIPANRLSKQNINIIQSYWYNPVLNYKTFMVPGILVLLVTIIGMFLSGMNLVREKEIGTIEQINVTPIKKYQFIVGKLLPFWLIALFELALGLTIGKLIFDIPLVGSLLLLFGVAAIYLLVVLGLGLFISTITETQQQAMFISWFFLLVFILMSGLFTSVESMPEWAQWINKANPIAYFMRVIRMILLKGSGFFDIVNEIVSLSIYAVVMLSLAVTTYRKVA